MIKKIIVFINIIFCCVLLSFGQDTVKVQTVKSIEVHGKVVTQRDNRPILGATVLIKRTNKGVATNLDGRFKIQANIGDRLIISSLGFETTEFEIIDDKEITVYLMTNSETLKQITIIGYGVQEKRDLTGAISTIKGSDLDKAAISFDNALAGRISGVLVSSSSGAPGGATAITIRGITSLNTNSNNPLFVINGTPIYGTNRSNNITSFKRSSFRQIGFGGTFVTSPLENRLEFERNPLALLNIADIESIEVLKDAYATAIYGSRGAAGVILITTRKGTTKKPIINVHYTISVTSPIDLPDILNGQEYANIYTIYSEQNNYPEGINTNWPLKVTRIGISHNIDASFSAYTEKLNYYGSLLGFKQQSYIVNQDYSKYSFHANIAYKIKTNLKLGLNTIVSHSNNKALNAPQIYRNAVLKAPNIPEKTDTGDYFFGFEPNISGLTENPVAQAYKDINRVKDNRTIGNVYLEFKPFKGLRLKSQVGIDHLNSISYSRLISRPVPSAFIGGNATQTRIKNKKFVTNNTISFVKIINKIHSINSVIGQSFETSTEKSASIFGRDFASDDILDINRAGVVGGNPNFTTRAWALFSVFGRLNYQYDHKYLAGVTYRVDGSSRFNKSNRYIGFPSFSLGWRISEENFLKDVSWLDQLKFRGSIGFTGIDGTSGYYGNQGQYELLRQAGLDILYAGSQILQVVKPINPNLKWERTRSLDLGLDLDLDLFGNRVSLQADYYHKKITNLLYASAVPWYQGYAIQQQNIGDMENKGFEFQLETQNIKTSNFSWVTNFNIARNTNKILKLNFEGNDFTNSASLGYKYFAEGQSAGQFFLYDWAGVNSLTGNPLWNYPDGTQSEIPPASLHNSIQYRKPMGDALPDFFGGIVNIFTYKNWEFTSFFSFSYGNQLYNGTKALLYTYTTTDAHNLSTNILNYWLIPGHNTDIPKLNNASIISYGSAAVDYTTGRDSDRFLEDASYIKLKNVSLKYHFPKSFLDRTFIKRLTLNVQATNLLTFTKYSGLDPEVSAFGSSALLSGYDELTLPQPKSFSLGIHIGF